jgi:predicted nucleotidyltransferase
MSTAAYASVQHALTKATSPLTGKGVEIFLHGSYANATHVYADSDIDVVVFYGNTFHKDMSTLPPAQQALHERVFPRATYLWENLRSDVLTALRAHYGYGAVTEGSKAIKVHTGVGRMVADIVPAVQFRKYAHFASQDDLSAHWGIHFRDSAGNAIVNYPKYHSERGEDKNSARRARGQYKATIRIFKNLRNYMVENRFLAEGVAPSYYIECALHNVPDHLFAGNFDDTVPAILNYLLTTPYAGFMCQNGVVPLIGTGRTQWSEQNFVSFVVAAHNAWQQW